MLLGPEQQMILEFLFFVDTADVAKYWTTGQYANNASNVAYPLITF